MSFTVTKLSFTIADLHSCKLLGVVDTSIYDDNASGYTLQVQPPNGLPLKELGYYPNGVTVLNSNSIGLTNVIGEENYQDLPDGIYTIKISVCPYESNWYEKTFYRTCQLQCKYNKAFLKLEMSKCTNCYNSQLKDTLDTAWDYIQGVSANIGDCNFKKANELYSVANSLLDNILECDDCK